MKARLWTILLLHNPLLSVESLIEIGDFLVKKFHLDQTSIWDLDEEYLTDLCAGE